VNAPGALKIEVEQGQKATSLGLRGDAVGRMRSVNVRRQTSSRSSPDVQFSPEGDIEEA
jgi:hypothetical protein